MGSSYGLDAHRLVVTLYSLLHTGALIRTIFVSSSVVVDVPYLSQHPRLD
jgi:hypothetical protein